MAFQRIYVTEPCPLDGYDDLSVRVLANATDREWRTWAEGDLGAPGCPDCAKLNEPKTPRGKQSAPLGADPWPRRYCESCTKRRQQFGQSIVLFYGPRLLDRDVSTVDAALALFDDDDALPSEIVIWLQLLPSQIRDRRTKALMGN